MDTILSGTDEDRYRDHSESETSTFAMLNKIRLTARSRRNCCFTARERADHLLESSPNPGRSFCQSEYWQELKNNTTAILNGFHQKPFKAGMNREDLRASLGLSQLIFDIHLINWSKKTNWPKR